MPTASMSLPSVGAMPQPEPGPPETTPLPPFGARQSILIDGRGEVKELRDLGRHRRRSMKGFDRAGLWVSDRLPLALRGHFAIGGRELGLIALVGAVALCVVAALALRSSAAAATPSRPASSLVAATASASVTPLVVPSAKSSGVVVVDVAGAVRHPGVLTLPVGSRVYEALKAAGGARRGTDVSGLNLARVMTDGEQIVVGAKPPPSAARTAADSRSSSIVSINHASESELETLPGVGPVMAKKIIDWREAHGGFSRVEDLKEVAGIGVKTFAKLAPLIGL